MIIGIIGYDFKDSIHTVEDHIFILVVSASNLHELF